jgi:hypothetical protein
MKEKIHLWVMCWDDAHDAAKTKGRGVSNLIGMANVLVVMYPWKCKVSALSILKFINQIEVSLGILIVGLHLRHLHPFQN